MGKIHANACEKKNAVEIIMLQVDFSCMLIFLVEVPRRMDSKILNFPSRHIRYKIFQVSLT